MKLNGNSLKLNAPATLQEFLRDQGFDVSKIAVEKNGEIIPKANYEVELLTDADSLEVVSFVGGG